MVCLAMSCLYHVIEVRPAQTLDPPTPADAKYFGVGEDGMEAGEEVIIHPPGIRTRQLHHLP